MGDINERVLSEARYLIKTEKTVREISKVFKVSKVLFIKIYMRD